MPWFDNDGETNTRKLWNWLRGLFGWEPSSEKDHPISYNLVAHRGYGVGDPFLLVWHQDHADDPFAVMQDRIAKVLAGIEATQAQTTMIRVGFDGVPYSDRLGRTFCSNWGQHTERSNAHSPINDTYHRILRDFVIEANLRGCTVCVSVKDMNHLAHGNLILDPVARAHGMKGAYSGPLMDTTKREFAAVLEAVDDLAVCYEVTNESYSKEQYPAGEWVNNAGAWLQANTDNEVGIWHKFSIPVLPNGFRPSFRVAHSDWRHEGALWLVNEEKVPLSTGGTHEGANGWGGDGTYEDYLALIKACVLLGLPLALAFWEWDWTGDAFAPAQVRALVDAKRLGWY